MSKSLAHRGASVLKLGVAGLVAGAMVAALAPVAGAATRAQIQNQAKKYLLVLKDMPAGWKAQGSASTGSGSGTFPGARQLASCIGVSPKLITSNPPQANSPFFQNAAGSLEVQDSVLVFPSAHSAQVQFNAITNAKTPGCMSTLVNTSSFKNKVLGSAAQQASVGAITVTGVRSGAYGPGSAGLILRIPISDQGQTVSAALTEIFFIKGNLGHELSFNSYNSTFPLSLAKRLTSVAQNRS
jgi:hypothetical protein